MAKRDPGEMVRFNVFMSSEQALAFAQFLKRAEHDDFEACAISERETQNMLQAGDAIRKALKQVGYAPGG